MMPLAVEPPKRQLGRHKDELKNVDSMVFFEPLSDAELEAWEGK